MQKSGVNSPKDATHYRTILGLTTYYKSTFHSELWHTWCWFEKCWQPTFGKPYFIKQLCED